MRAKKKWGILCVTILSLTLLTACSQTSQVEETIEQLIVSKRLEGYNQAVNAVTIDMRYLMNHDIPESIYNEYTEARKQYEENPSSENFQVFVDLTKEILQDLPVTE